MVNVQVVVALDIQLHNIQYMQVIQVQHVVIDVQVHLIRITQVQENVNILHLYLELDVIKLQYKMDIVEHVLVDIQVVERHIVKAVLNQHVIQLVLV